MSQVIPEAAVEAALKEWGVGGEVPRNIVNMILEAAAPHLLAEAWDAGEEAGQDNADSNRGFDVEHKRNPYRPTP